MERSMLDHGSIYLSRMDTARDIKVEQGEVILMTVRRSKPYGGVFAAEADTNELLKLKD